MDCEESGSWVANRGREGSYFSTSFQNLNNGLKTLAQSVWAFGLPHCSFAISRDFWLNKTFYGLWVSETPFADSQKHTQPERERKGEKRTERRERGQGEKLVCGLIIWLLLLRSCPSYNPNFVADKVKYSTPITKFISLPLSPFPLHLHAYFYNLCYRGQFGLKSTSSIRFS